MIGPAQLIRRYRRFIGTDPKEGTETCGDDIILLLLYDSLAPTRKRVLKRSIAEHRARHGHQRFIGTDPKEGTETNLAAHWLGYE